MTPEEYNDCIDTHADGLYRFVLGIVVQKHEAQDIVQESFARLWERLHKVEEGCEKSYLFTIAHRLSIDALRKRKRKQTTSNEEAVFHATEDMSYDNSAEILRRTVEALPDHQRVLILLRDYEGYPYHEIAQITNLTESQVKINIYRARLTLKKQLAGVNR